MKMLLLQSLLNRAHKGGLMKLAIIVALTVFAIFTLGGIGILVLVFTVVLPFLQNMPTEAVALNVNFQSLLSQFGIPTAPAVPTDVNSFIDTIQQQYLGGEETEGEVAGESVEPVDQE